MHKIDAPGATDSNTFTEGNPASGTPATQVGAKWLNAVQAEIVAVVEAAGITLDDEDDAQLLAALKTIGGYDIPFIAGFASDGTGEDLAVQLYGSIVLPRAITIIGEQLYMGTAPTGADAIFDIRKNGSTIYSTLPEVAISANAGTAGVLTTVAGVACAAGDRIDFRCTQVGATIKGQLARFAVKGIVT